MYYWENQYEVAASLRQLSDEYARAKRKSQDDTAQAAAVDAFECGIVGVISASPLVDSFEFNPRALAQLCWAWVSQQPRREGR